MATAGEGLLERVAGHARKCWPAARLATHRWRGGGLVENLPDLAVLEVAPETGASVYLSAGASAEPMEDGYGLEFILRAPGGSDAAVKLVAMVAQLHGDPRYPISLGQVLEIGHPWLPGAGCDHLMVALTDAFPPEVEWYSDLTHTIRFTWLVPIYAAEASVARERGYPAVLQQLGRAGVDPADPTRAPS